MAISTPRSAPPRRALLGPADARHLAAGRPAAGPWARAYRRLRKKRLAMAGAVILAVIAATAVLVPLGFEIDPYYQDLSSSLLPPGSPGHPFGTDQNGRDLLLR